jgi:hypothetical protein
MFPPPHPYNKELTATLVAVSVALTISACTQQAATKQGAEQVAAPQLNNDDYYEVHDAGRIYIFDDAATYLSFMGVGETAYRLTRIGAGGSGETVVFGLRKEDKKKRSGIGGVDMYDGKIEGAESFYGEIVKERRIFVFSTWKDVKDFQAVGEAVYRYTDIGVGPNGETVVYVLNNGNKRQQPGELVARFKALHSQN